jgi:hypothetical protein
VVHQISLLQIIAAISDRASQMQNLERLPLPLKEKSNKKPAMGKLYYPKAYLWLIVENSPSLIFSLSLQLCYTAASKI